MARRYPLEPLLDASGLTMTGLRRLVPMSGQTYRNAIDLGLLPDQADRWAVRVGLHPAEVWGSWAADMEQDVLADKRARRNQAMRKWRATAAGKAATQRHNSRYFAETAEYHRRRARQRYWSNPEQHRAARRERYRRIREDTAA